MKEELEKLRASSDDQAKEQLKIFFIMDKVAEKLKIDVTEEEINGHIAQLAIRRGQRPERVQGRNGSATGRWHNSDFRCAKKSVSQSCSKRRR